MNRRSDYLEHLGAVPLFSTCTRAEVEQIARRADSISVEAGHQLTVEGDLGYEFFVVVEGEAAVSRAGRRMATLGPGSYFGELALLDRAPRNATVTALTRMQLMVLNRADFESILIEVPSMTMRLLAGMARRLRAHDELAATEAGAIHAPGGTE